MLKVIFFFIITSFGILHSPIQGEEPLSKPLVSTSSALAPTPIEPFTGKIMKNNVRLRLQPNTDCLILKELNHHDLVMVTGETEDFYAVQPPSDFKGYVFRTFVLDGVIEGNKVNVRLEPSTDSPVLGQLNTGYRVEGHISPLNSKWLEISLPKNISFFVCKEYVENIGDPSVMVSLLQRNEKVEELLMAAKVIAGLEMQKVYEEMEIKPLLSELQQIINNYADFPEYITQAKELFEEVQENFLHKKLAFLEHKAGDLSNKLASQASIKEEIAQVSTSDFPILVDPEPSLVNNEWIPIEKKYYDSWLKNHPNSTMENFYTEQKRQSILIKGIIEPYSRPIRNKPGDYILISKITQLPSAYLYSTLIDLKTEVGHEVTLRVVPRPNHNFAFPAYFVLSFEN